MAIIFLLFAICITLFLLTYFDHNRKLMLNEFFSMFRPTVFFDYQIDMDTIKEVEIMGTVPMQQADDGGFTFSNKHKIIGIFSYLNEIPLVKADRSELPNMSPDLIIRVSDGNEEVIGTIWIYGQVFIENRDNGELYRSKRYRIIEGLENIEFN